MNETRGLTDVFSEVGGEGNYIVVGSLLDFIDALDGKLRPRFNLFQRVLGDGAHLSVDFADSNLDIQPLLESALLAPERAHFGECVSFDHLFLVSSFKFRVPS